MVDKQDLKVYIIELDRIEDLEEDIDIIDVSGDKFIEMSNKFGSVYSLIDFQEAINADDINLYNSYIRFI